MRMNWMSLHCMALYSNKLRCSAGYDRCQSMIDFHLLKYARDNKARNARYNKVLQNTRKIVYVGM
jgi:hypothetical protein